MEHFDSLQIRRELAERVKNHSVATGKPPKSVWKMLYSALEDSMVRRGALKRGLFEEARRWDQNRPVIEYIENRGMLGEMMNHAQELLR